MKLKFVLMAALVAVSACAPLALQAQSTASNTTTAKPPTGKPTGTPPMGAPTGKPPRPPKK